MNNNYFNVNEDRDYLMMVDLNSKLNLTELGQTPCYSHYDASGKTSYGEIVTIELKNRKQNYIDGKLSGTTYTADTMMIEAHKASTLLFEHVIHGYIPLYINFTNNGTVAIVFNLTKLKEIPTKRNYNTITSKGYERTENGDRLLLPLSDAYIYKKINDKWVSVKNANIE